MEITKKYVNDISFKIIGAAIEVHRNLGPGLLESVYQKCLVKELKLRKIKVWEEVQVPIIYKEDILDEKLRLDLLVEDLVIVENKSVETLHPIYTSQLLTYLKLADKPKGLLINFNSDNIVKAMVPLVTKSFRDLPDE